MTWLLNHGEPCAMDPWYALHLSSQGCGTSACAQTRAKGRGKHPMSSMMEVGPILLLLAFQAWFITFRVGLTNPILNHCQINVVVCIYERLMDVTPILNGGEF